MKKLFEVEWDDKVLGNEWLNVYNLECLLFSENYTKRELLKVRELPNESATSYPCINTTDIKATSIEPESKWCSCEEPVIFKTTSWTNDTFCVQCHKEIKPTPKLPEKLPEFRMVNAEEWNALIDYLKEQK